MDAVRVKVGFCDEYATGVYYVLDCCGAGARREIARNAPPQVRFFTENKSGKSLIEISFDILDIFQTDRYPDQIR